MRRAGALVGLGRIVGAVLSGASDSDLVRVSMQAAGELVGAALPSPRGPRGPRGPRAGGVQVGRPIECAATVDGVPVLAELVDGSKRRRYRPK